MATRTIDRAKRQRNPVKTSRAERQYASKLRRIAESVGAIIDGFPAGDPASVPPIEAMLRRYADALTDWATATASQMIAEVNASDRRAWMQMSQDMSVDLRREIQAAPTGEAMRTLLAEQVTLIKSIPLDAAQRVHDLTLKGIDDATRASEIAAEIQRSGEVAESRAMLIARTEVSRTASTLTQARAQYIGSTGYIWRTAGDSDVRKSHKDMRGKFVPWSTPPTLDGLTGHAGCLPNCRCYPEPVIPE
ncbi:phage head morphogenesis protein [Chitiniphilus shinanonensis]|uniref:phage head morphogenesis protein n=1 Tax=Chitiniphilus shinanonensis TaxID=553088 RepID=UPI00302B3A68